MTSAILQAPPLTRPTLAELVGDTADFLTATWRRVPRVHSTDTSWTGALSVADLDRVLACGTLTEPYLEMVEGGRHLPVRRYTTPRPVGPTAIHTAVDPGKVRTEVSKGATVLLRNVEHWHAPVAALVQSLAGELGRKTEAFYFLSPPDRQALPAHRDDADVFVIQVQGSKSWTVHTPPTDGNWAPSTEREPGDIALRTVLHPGDVLYVPRGAAHCATGVGPGLSAHLSLTVREIGTAQLQDALRTLLAADLFLPPRPVDDAGLAQIADRLLDHYQARLAALSAEELVATARTALATRPDMASELASL
ncbi:JmjC domain-containing protein [Streptomyces sp. NPDC059564]|uniref:JmjC domain-containing protein n=1 Tax=Streptomyces sp. NPDC059564 TaxID=3346865 RepID=UPI0036C07CC5